MVLKTVRWAVFSSSQVAAVSPTSRSQKVLVTVRWGSLFLGLLTAQLKHQDPMAPADDKAFIAQLAQFSALEQQMKGNDMLSRIEMAQALLLFPSTTGLIGKEVTAEGDQILLTQMRQLHRFVSG